MNNRDTQFDGVEGRENPCTFMRLPRCMRQDVTKRLDLDICQACILGRVEGHLFSVAKDKNAPRDPMRRD